LYTLGYTEAEAKLLSLAIADEDGTAADLESFSKAHTLELFNHKYVQRFQKPQ
jgi:hypothetical protein